MASPNLSNQQTQSPADIWDQVVSLSMSKLASGAPSVEPLKKLDVKPQSQRRHCLVRNRDPSRIDAGLRQTIRDAAAGIVKWPIFVTGRPGTGKTCAGLCVADHVHGSEWWSWDEFWRFVGDVNFGRASTMFGGEKNPEGYTEPSKRFDWTPQTFWKWFRGLPLAVIDDVGLRATANDTQYEALKMALDQRESLPLIVTSNNSVDAIGEIFDARIMDRIECGTVVELNGKSQR